MPSRLTPADSHLLQVRKDEPREETAGVDWGVAVLFQRARIILRVRKTFSSGLKSECCASPCLIFSPLKFPRTLVDLLKLLRLYLSLRVTLQIV